MPSADPSTDDRPRRSLGRRQLLGSGLMTAVVGLAGCSAPSDGDDDTLTPAPTPGSPFPDPSPTDETPTEGGDAGPTPLQGPWPTAHADAANTGAVTASGPRGETSVRWRGHVDLQSETWAAAGPDGPVVTVADGTVVAYAPDGSRQWRDRHAGSFRAAPVVAEDGTVVVGREDGRVIAYTPTGDRRWEESTPDGLFAPHANDATPLRVAGDRVVLAHPQGELSVFSLADGSGWTVSASGQSHRPAVADGRVVVTSRNRGEGPESVIAAYALADGSEHWRKTSQRSISIAPGVALGTVYTADIDGLVVAQTLADGTEQWHVRIDGKPWISTIPTVFDGLVWVGTLEAGLYALDADGVVTHVDVPVSGTPATGDGRLYVGRTDRGESVAGRAQGAVVALAPDGTEQWRTRIRGVPVGQVQYRDGTVVCGTLVGVAESLDATDGTRRWREFERPPRLPSPAVGPRTVYCGSRRDDVTGYRATDGTSHLWTVGFGGSATATPTVAGNTVLASGAGSIAGTPPLEYADPPGRLTVTPTPAENATPDPHIDAPSPEPRWRVQPGGRLGSIGYAEYAYVGSGTQLLSLSAGGQTRWETDIGDPVRRTPAHAAGGVYAVTTAGAVVAVDPEDGTERWRRSVGATTAPVVANGTLVVGTRDGIVALTADDGGERWRRSLGRIRSAPAVSDGRLVTGTGSGMLYGLALADGTEQWQVETDGAIHGSPAIADGVAYVGSRDRHLYAVRISSGTVKWKHELADWVDGSPAVGHGAVFVVDQSGALTAVVGET